MKETITHQPGEALTDVHQTFVTYIATRQFLAASMIKNVKPGNPVHIPLKEIEQRFFVYPAYSTKIELQRLQQAGEIAITENKATTGNKMFLYAALRAGDLDLSLIIPKPIELGETSRFMKDCLWSIYMPPKAQSTPYFDFFLEHRFDFPDLFFIVDEFAKRVHTPVTNFPSLLRNQLELDGIPTMAFDVAQMQPTLLANILRHEIGENQFTNWIDTGHDIYTELQKLAQLETRKQAKDRFYQITFAPPTSELAKLFGAARWIDWINEYKSKPNPQNPHDRNKRYSSLAWRLQNDEVRIMRQIWRKLHTANIRFLSVHDEVIVKRTQAYEARIIINEVLSDEFKSFQLNNK